MPQVKKNGTRKRKIIDLDPDTLRILDLYAYDQGTDSKNLIQNSMDDIAEIIKKDHPEMVKRPASEQKSGLKGFKLRNNKIKPKRNAKQSPKQQ